MALARSPTLAWRGLCRWRAAALVGGAWQRRVQAEGDAVVSAELDADDAASGAADADRVSAAVWGGCDPAGSERGGFRRDPEPALYFKWINGIRKGDWGQSFEWQKPVSELIWERLGLTMALSLGALLVGWFIAIPVGVYSATHQYSWLDYLMTTFSFIGLGTPGFLLALIILFLAQSWLGINVGGLFSDEYMLEPWSWPKVVDMLKHIWVPLLIVAVNGTAGNIRITRANLLDEINKPYVETARAKGVRERNLIWKYPVRVALNPFISTIGWSLASLVSGTTLVAMVLSLQTTGPMLLRSLTSQDMYLAGSFLFLLSALTVVGTLLSDILLAIVDPRIHMES